MGKILGIVAAALAAVTAAGCQQQPKPAGAAQTALDVRPLHKLTPTYALSPEAVTPPDEPKAALGTGPMVMTPDLDRGPAARPGKTARTGAPAGTAQGSSYKVKKGDTLYHIAKAEYGDGKKWTLIASANPGVSPESLKTGQTLRIP